MTGYDAAQNSRDSYALAIDSLREGARFLRPSLPEGERVVSAFEYRDQIVVVATCGVYVMKDGKLEPVTFQTRDGER